MRATLLDATPTGHDAARQASDALRRCLAEQGYLLEVFNLAELPVAPCRGCFACWVVTPGRCPHEDASQVMARALIGADMAVLFSPLAFGGYSWLLKQTLDRMICLISPFFDTQGLTRHKARYMRFPAMLGVGWLPAPDPEATALFERVVEHNAYNLRAPKHLAITLCGHKDWAVQRLACQAALGGFAP